MKITAHFKTNKTGNVHVMLTLRYIYITIPATKEQQVLNIMSVNVCVCILALITQHANQTFSVWYYTVTCGLPDSAIFFHK
jgi:hypothetical protein